MKKLLLPLLFSILALNVLYAQDQSNSDLKFRKWRVTLFTPIGTNGVDAPDYTARYSINLLYGYHGGLDGVEFGTLVNYNKRYSNGFMVAGLANISGGDISGLSITPGFNYAHSSLSGLHFAGLFNLSRGGSDGLHISSMGNVTGGDLEGLNISGFVNFARNNLSGLQISGFGNFSGNDSEGLLISGATNFSVGDQEGLILSGIGNISGGDVSGLSAAGIFNYGRNIEGLTASGFANIASDMQGLQFSTVNISDRAEGLQIGLINFANEFNGMPVGLISYYGNGRKNIDIRTSDAGFTEIGLNLGTYRVYNMALLGFNTALDRDVYRLGWAIGFEQNIKDAFKNAKNESFYVNQELSVVRNFENEIDFDQPLNTIWSYKYLLGKKFSSGFSLYAGPTLNMQISKVNGSSDYTWYSIWSPERKDRQYRFWLGFNIGLRFFKQKNMDPSDLNSSWN